MQNYLQAWDNSNHSELVKSHGEFSFLFIALWLKMEKMKEREESKRMLKLVYHFPGYLQEWSSMRKRELKKLNNKRN